VSQPKAPKEVLLMTAPVAITYPFIAGVVDNPKLYK